MLKQSIPQEWRKKLKTMRVPMETISFEEQITLPINKINKPIQLIKNRDFYWALIRNFQEKPIVLDRILNDLNIVNKEDYKWGKIFLVNKAVRDTKLRAFQYKILFNLIPCKVYLKKIKKSDTHNCDKCNEKEDLDHYFYNCQYTQTFWNSFKLWWKNTTEEEIILQCSTVKLGIIENHEKNETLNACIIYAKWHIYKNKLNSEDLFFYKYLCDLRYYISIEKNIALRQNKIQNYNKKWHTIEDNMT
jgi:hypothetical protein